MELYQLFCLADMDYSLRFRCDWWDYRTILTIIDGKMVHEGTINEAALVPNYFLPDAVYWELVRDDVPLAPAGESYLV